MLSFLKSVFGSDITETEYRYVDNTPYYIRDGYAPQLLIWGQNQCIILTPKDPSRRLPALKKQLKKFQEICTIPCALGLENLTALQRRNLIENHIPFVSMSQQVYFPFWGCSFREQFKAKTVIADKMAPGTQLVFLYLYYVQSTEPVNLTQIAKALSLSKATCTRAINDLTASGLITQNAEGTHKWITPAYGKPEFLKKGRKYDIIVSNPPYIPSSEIEKLDKNVRECDPLVALDGGEDGLDFYREIISKLGKRLNSGGYVFFEVGKGQASEVKKLLKESGFEEIKTTKDYNKIERIVSGKYR